MVTDPAKCSFNLSSHFILTPNLLHDISVPHFTLRDQVVQDVVEFGAVVMAE